MTEKDLSQIESNLKATLPKTYREVVVGRAGELEKTNCFTDELSTFYLDPEEVIRINQMERKKDSDTAHAFPKWWQTYFLVGTDGAGNYYCLRLDDKPGVWMIGSDCGDKPNRVARSLKVFLDDRLKEDAAEQHREEAPSKVAIQEGAVEPLGDAGADDEVGWDFAWNHPTIDSVKIKRRLQEFGTQAGTGKVDDEAALAFARWLEVNGDKAWANYIRVRRAVDKAPGSDYADTFEMFLEAAAAMRPGHPTLDEFFFRGYTGNEQWWEKQGDEFEGGLPSIVKFQPGQAGTAARLIKAMQGLVGNSPVRGMDFEWHHAQEMGKILDSAGARHLRWISFCNRPENGRVGPVIAALVQSPIVRTLERLDIQDGLQSDADALALADAPFERLRRLDVQAMTPVACSAEAATRLMTAPWFRRLERAHIGFGEDCCEIGMLHLANMPHLHTLALWLPPDRQILALARAGEFPALKRLFVHHANLTGSHREAFAQLRAPKLSELWLRNSAAKKADVCALAGSAWFHGLRALTFDGTAIDEEGLAAVAASGCAAALRILRIVGNDSRQMAGSFRALAATPLTKPGAFPELTTLELDYPYAKKAHKDMAVFLRKLATPKLRHLKLGQCGLDDDCAEAIGTCPVFGDMTRLVMGRATLSTKAAKKLFGAPNLQSLVDLKIEPDFGPPRDAMGKALEMLLDQSVMPRLSRAWFSATGVAEDTIERLKAERPGFWISQF